MNFLKKIFKNNPVFFSFVICFGLFFVFFYSGYITGEFVSTTKFPDLLINKKNKKKIPNEIIGELKLRKFSEPNNVTTEMIDYETKTKFKRNESENCKNNKKKIILRRCK